MDNTREKLIELLKSGGVDLPISTTEYLIAGGVKIPVLCKECKHFTEGMAVGMCKRIADKPIMPIVYDHFCSYGERRAEE